MAAGRPAVWLLAPLVVLALSRHGAAHASGDRIFVTNQGDDTVSVVDTALDREVVVIPVGASPQGLALRPEPALLAVANSGASHATLIDPVALAPTADVLPTGQGPEDVAFSADGTRLFATSYYGSSVSVTDVASRTPVGDPIVFSRKPRRVLPAPDGARLFVLLHDREGAVAVVSVATRTVETTISVGPFPSAFALSPDGARLFAASFDGNTVTAIDLTTLAPADTFHLDTGAGLAVHPSRPLLYSLLDLDGQILVFDHAARRTVATVTAGTSPTDGVVTPDGRFLYVVDNEANHLAKIDTDSNRPLGRIAVGIGPEAAVLFRPAPSGRTHPGWAAAAVAAAVAAMAAWTLARLLSGRRRAGPASG